MDPLTIWKLTPTAAPDDPRWLDHRPVSALFVSAASPAHARVVASREDVPPGAGKVGNESAHAHSRFGDEKLYRVDRADADEARGLGPPPREPAVLARVPTP